MKKKYMPIPVKAAKDIAEKYEKCIVIINAWDNVHGLLHITTYGVSEQDKLNAASGGDISAEALGAYMPAKTTYQDFREPKLVLKEFCEWMEQKTGAMCGGDPSGLIEKFLVTTHGWG